jgi:hypothetical protein
MTQADKNSPAIDQNSMLADLVSMYSHQVQNEMTVVVAHAELAFSQCHEIAMLKTHLDEIRGAAMRTSALSKSLYMSHSGLISASRALPRAK